VSLASLFGSDVVFNPPRTLRWVVFGAPCYAFLVFLSTPHRTASPFSLTRVPLFPSPGSCPRLTEVLFIFLPFPFTWTWGSPFFGLLVSRSVLPTSKMEFFCVLPLFLSPPLQWGHHYLSRPRFFLSRDRKFSARTPGDCDFLSISPPPSLPLFFHLALLACLSVGPPQFIAVPPRSCRSCPSSPLVRTFPPQEGVEKSTGLWWLCFFADPGGQVVPPFFFYFFGFRVLRRRRPPSHFFSGYLIPTEVVFSLIFCVSFFSCPAGNTFPPPDYLWRKLVEDLLAPFFLGPLFGRLVCSQPVT